MLTTVSAVSPLVALAVANWVAVVFGTPWRRSANPYDFAGGQIVRDSTADDLLNLDFDQIYPLAGPIHVEGAEPGDVLAVELLAFELPEWGWAMAAPGFGLLPPGELDQPNLKFFDLTT